MIKNNMDKQWNWIEVLINPNIPLDIVNICLELGFRDMQVIRNSISRNPNLFLTRLGWYSKK